METKRNSGKCFFSIFVERAKAFQINLQEAKEKADIKKKYEDVLDQCKKLEEKQNKSSCTIM